MQQPDWPEPDRDAQEHSARLVEVIRQRIESAGGTISFEQYMDLALYAPGLGYYTAGARKFGESGDFITAPEVSPLFARCLARQCEEVFNELGGGDILEPGAGSGVMAADVLAELDARGALPSRYLILETSAELRERQLKTLQKRVPQHLDRVTWLDGPPESFRGILLANEVLDALPVARFRIDDEGYAEQHVGWTGSHFITRWRPANETFTDELHEALINLPAPLRAPYISERCRRLPAFVRMLAESMQAGLMLFIDYGYPRR
ncbi:MAG: SAM-dependent methyltransferase, partial [Proteobacteria bacterium]|nr:SAM-dependent methyltransferase [Pseudomonadota bacterium]